MAAAAAMSLVRISAMPKPYQFAPPSDFSMASVNEVSVNEGFDLPRGQGVGEGRGCVVLVDAPHLLHAPAPILRDATGHICERR
jgi:hypothetical protein